MVTALVIVQRTDLRRDLEPYGVVVLDRAGELQFHAVGLELDGDSSEIPTRSLHNRIGKLAASQEARRLTTDGQQVGFGQNLQNLFLLEILNGRAQVNIRTEQKDVQQVR